MEVIIKGRTLIIDPEDYNLVTGIQWHSYAGHGYLSKQLRYKGKYRTLYLHRFLAGAPKDLVVDHINHNILDNRRSNLRVVTHSDNHRNSGKAKGVYFSKRHQRWYARIGYSLNGKRKMTHLGSSKDINIAKALYKTEQLRQIKTLDAVQALENGSSNAV